MLNSVTSPEFMRQILRELLEECRRARSPDKNIREAIIGVMELKIKAALALPGQPAVPVSEARAATSAATE